MPWARGQAFTTSLERAPSIIMIFFFFNQLQQMQRGGKNTEFCVVANEPHNSSFLTNILVTCIKLSIKSWLNISKKKK